MRLKTRFPFLRILCVFLLGGKFSEAIFRFMKGLYNCPSVITVLFLDDSNESKRQSTEFMQPVLPLKESNINFQRKKKM